MKTWMINYFNVVRCHPLYVNSQSNHVTWTSYSFLHEKKHPKKYKPWKRSCFSSTFRERESRWSETRTNTFHPFFHPIISWNAPMTPKPLWRASPGFGTSGSTLPQRSSPSWCVRLVSLASLVSLVPLSWGWKPLACLLSHPQGSEESMRAGRGEHLYGHIFYVLLDQQYLTRTES